MGRPADRVGHAPPRAAVRSVYNGPTFDGIRQPGSLDAIHRLSTVEFSGVGPTCPCRTSFRGERCELTWRSVLRHLEYLSPPGRVHEVDSHGCEVFRAGRERDDLDP